MQASKFGYVTQSATNVVVTEGNTTNRNFVLPLAAQGTVSGIVTDCNGGPSVGATVEVLNTPVVPATTNGSGFYSITLPQGTYDMRASKAGCAPHQVAGVVVGATATQNFTLLSDPRFQCSPDDAYGYGMCENVDAGGVAFSWNAVTPLEGGAGTAVLPSTDDGATAAINFPFVFQFYGTIYTSYYISSNGIVTFGTSNTAYSNSCFQTAMPEGLYINWDDMITTGGQVAYYYDAANHWLVISYYNIGHFSGGGSSSFQVVIYDEAFYSSATGDNHILFQYADPTTQTGASTTGIKTAAGTFQQYACNGVVDANSWGLEAGRTIYYSTGPGCVGAGEIVITPPTLSGSAPVGGTDTGSIQICNTGGCPLSWAVGWDQTTPALALSSYVPADQISMTKAQIELIEAINRGEKPVINVEDRDGQSPLDAQGGPDAFGYRWIDSDEPGGPTYSWVEINAIGVNTGISGDDQVFATALPFTFSFYGIDYNSVNISSNGNIHFGGANAAYTNLALPSASAPLAMIAPFWDDLYPPTQGEVYYYNDVANNRFIVEWDDIVHIGSTTEIYNFQILLYSTGRIVMQYETMFTGGTYGVTTSTIGLNNETGTVGLQVVYNAAYLHSNMAIQLQAATDWLTITPPMNGSLDPGQCVTVPVTFEAGDLPAGTYNGNLVVSSSDPDEALTNIPVTFTVGSYNPPLNLTIYYLPGTNQLRFDWIGSGAPMYELYSAVDSDGPYNTLVGSTAGTTLTIAHDGSTRKFFHVVATGGVVLGSASLPEGIDSAK